MNMKLLVAAFAALLLASACSKEAPAPVAAPVTPPAANPAVVVNEVADDYYAHVMSTTPEAAYFSGIELDRHDGLANNSLAAGAANDAVIDTLLARLRTVDGRAFP